MQAKFSIGLCLPKVCTAKDLEEITKLFENEVKFPLHLVFVDDFCDSGEGKPLTSAAIVAM